MAGTNKMTGTFEGKPETLRYFQYIDAYIRPLDGVETEVKSQISYKVFRKFLWMWSYEKTADGTLFLSFLLDKKIKNSFIHGVSQISKNRWNHSVVIKSAEDAQCDELKNALLQSYRFASKK